MNTGRAVAVILLCGVALVARAETAYVTDQLQLGIHEAAQVSSPILALLPSGSAVEVLERDGDMARVRTDDGVSGWMDGRFLTTDPPGNIARVRELEGALAGAQAALADAQAKLVVAEAAAGDSASTESQEVETIPSEALREMQRLAEENQRLKQQVAELDAVQRMSREQLERIRAGDGAVQPAAPSVAVASVVDAPRWNFWHIVLVASVLLLAFATGGWLMDWSVRRRHGGFRL